MKQFSILVVIVLSFSVLSCSILSWHEKKLIELDYEPVYRVEKLPQPVRQMFARRYSGIANPGQFYNAGCLIGPGQPRTQLCQAGISNDFGFVVFWVGGFVVRTKLLLYELDADQIISQSECYIANPIEDIDSLKTYVQTDRPGCRDPD